MPRIVGDLLLVGVGRVLRRDDHRRDFLGLVVLVEDGHLRLAVGPEKIGLAALAHFGEVMNQTVRHLDRKGHQLWSFIASVTEHHALVAGALFFMQAFTFGHSL